MSELQKRITLAVFAFILGLSTGFTLLACGAVNLVCAI